MLAIGGAAVKNIPPGASFGKARTSDALYDFARMLPQSVKMLMPSRSRELVIAIGAG
jgi:hypothetical protein